MPRTIASELCATGNLSTRWFHGLFAGKIVQPPTRGRLEPAARAAAAITATATVARMAIRRLIGIRVGNPSAGYVSPMSPPEESDQMPEEGAPGTSPDDTGAGESDEGGEDSAGTP